MKTLRKLFILLSLCCSVLWNSSSAEAAIIVAVQSTSITAGGTGFVDVLISSNSNDVLDFASYEFNIAAVGGPVSTLEFANPQILTEDQDASYVFFGDNLGINVVTLTNSTFIGDDATNSGTGVTLTATTSLLARLDLLHVLGIGQTAAQAAGEQFQISLRNSVDTRFEDTLATPIAFSSTSGTITVQAAAVPEPSTFAAIALAFGGFGVHRRRKNRKLETA